MKWAEIKEMTDAIKSICLLILYLGVTIFFFFFLWPIIAAKFQKNEMDLQSIDTGIFKFNAKEKSALKTIDSVSNQISKNSIDTSAISLKLYTAAKIIDTLINQPDQLWVYIGQIINNKLINTHFKINNLPQVGDLIVAKDAVYKRNTLPIELKDGNWKLGDIKGVVGDNESVSIIRISTIQGQNYWAQIK